MDGYQFYRIIVSPFSARINIVVIIIAFVAVGYIGDSDGEGTLFSHHKGHGKLSEITKATRLCFVKSICNGEGMLFSHHRVHGKLLETHQSK